MVLNAAKTENSAVHPLNTLNFDIDTITAKYHAERAKRLREDGVNQFKQAQGSYSHFQEDVGATSISRDPIIAETKVLIVGAGLGSVVAALGLPTREHLQPCYRSLDSSPYTQPIHTD